MRLVLVLALCSCWRSTPPEEPPPIAPRVPSDAPVARLDAALPDAALPDAALPDAALFPSGCLVARVLGLSVAGSDLVLVVGSGASHGVTPAWTARLTNPARTPAQIDRVDQVVTYLRISGTTADVIRASPTVTLCP